MKPYFSTDLGDLYNCDCLELMRTLPDQSVNCGVTSPPYWGLRDYGVDGQLGLEKTQEEYVEKLVGVFREFKRVLRNDGTLWLNLGDTYANNGTGGNGATGGRDKSTLASKMPPIGTTPVKKSVPRGLKPKDLVGIPWRVAFALQAGGWYLRQDIIWHKPNPMPESVTDRCTKAHEYIFLLSKSSKYYFDHEAIKEPCATSSRSREKNNGESAVDTKRRGYGSHCGTKDKRNKRSVWTVTTKPFKEAHFATFPPDLILPCVLAGCPERGVVMDMFSGAGTTALVAARNRRNFIAAELSEDYCEIAARRIEEETSQMSF
jgi:DNA modification methylase